MAVLLSSLISIPQSDESGLLGDYCRRLHEQVSKLEAQG